MNTPEEEKQIDGEEKRERRKGFLLRPSTTAEMTGTRRNRSATAEAKRGSRRPRVRGRGKKERGEWFGLTEPVRSG